MPSQITSFFQTKRIDRRSYFAEYQDDVDAEAAPAASRSDPSLSVRSARLRYGSLEALRGVDLELYPGELLGLLGPNGAGKTSLIQCLAGRRKLTSGSIEHHLSGDQREIIGIVPQEIALYQDLSVRQNLSAFASLQGIPRELLRETCQWALAWAKLEDKARAMVSTLSGGMQRRLNIACSVLHQPEILLLDEPTVGVDPQSRESIYDMLRDLLSQGTAMLLTTHHLEEAQDRCDRIAIIDEGKIVRTGTFEQLLSETVGSGQQVTIRFAQPAHKVPPLLTLSEDGTSASGELQNVSSDLPTLLNQLQRAHIVVDDLTLRSPTLQHIFLHLTGKELRE